MGIVLDLEGPLSKRERETVRQMGITVGFEDVNGYCYLGLPDGWRKVTVEENGPNPLTIYEEWAARQKQREKSCIVLDEKDVPRFKIDRTAIPYQIKLRYRYRYKVLPGRRGLMVRITERGKIINGFSFISSKKQEEGKGKAWVEILEANAIMQWLARDYPDWTTALC